MITLKTLATMQAALPRLDYMNAEQIILRTAFDLVEPKGDWKGPIDVVIGPSVFDVEGFDIDIVTRAIAYMTATEATVEETSEGYRVRAKGYRSGPAF